LARGFRENRELDAGAGRLIGRNPEPIEVARSPENFADCAGFAEEPGRSRPI